MKIVILYLVPFFLLITFIVYGAIDDSTHAEYLKNGSVALVAQFTSIVTPQIGIERFGFEGGLAIPIGSKKELRLEYINGNVILSEERVLGFQIKYCNYIHEDKLTSTFTGCFLASAFYYSQSTKLKDLPTVLTLSNNSTSIGAIFGMAFFPTQYLQLAAEYNLLLTHTRYTHYNSWSTFLNQEFRLYAMIKPW